MTTISIQRKRGQDYEDIYKEPGNRTDLRSITDGCEKATFALPGDFDAAWDLYLITLSNSAGTVLRSLQTWDKPKI